MEELRLAHERHLEEERAAEKERKERRKARAKNERERRDRAAAERARAGASWRVVDSKHPGALATGDANHRRGGRSGPRAP
jgi:hypothetical protein